MQVVEHLENKQFGTMYVIQLDRQANRDYIGLKQRVRKVGPYGDFDLMFYTRASSRSNDIKLTMETQELNKLIQFGKWLWLS